MSLELASFIKSGLSSVTGSSEMARRLSMAVVAVGLSVPATLGMSAAAPAWAAAKSAPAREAPAMQAPAPKAAEPTVMMPKDIAQFREEMAPFAAAAVRHDLDPVAFVSAVAMFHGFSNQELDPDSVTIAPSTGRKGERLKVLDKDAARWIDLVRAHGRDSGASLAVDALDAAMKLEDGKRRKPLVEATVRQIVEMWSDDKLEAEILAREVASIKAKLPKDAPALDGGQTYMAVAFGLPKMAAFGKALSDQLPENTKRHPAPQGPATFAFRVLDSSAENNPLFMEDLGNGRVKPLNALEFYGKVHDASENIKEMSRKAVEASSASLEEEEDYAGPRFG